MKLYIWRNVLCDWTCGIMFAMANSIEEARVLIINDWLEDDVEPEWRIRRAEAINYEISMHDPEVHEMPYGSYCTGGG